ncbi:DDE-type integrase/transposase/recombinase [Streptomyces sp. NPDC057199]|uniref:DDE-type integrase/transposase/recombinase n=1 Tax=Streptomyces sp. NPDC057199 TaxID=3346047 RepID=UPI00363B9D2E
MGGEKFLCLATVIDIVSRRLAGWAIAHQMRTELVTTTPTAAERTRGSLVGAVLHTDHDAQYISAAFAESFTRGSNERRSWAESTGTASARLASTPSPGCTRTVVGDNTTSDLVRQRDSRIACSMISSTRMLSVGSTGKGPSSRRAGASCR